MKAEKTKKMPEGFSCFCFSVGLLTIIFLSSCAEVKPLEQPAPVSLRFIEGTVQSISANETVLSLKLPAFKPTPDIPISEIAQQIVQKSLFLEGIKTEINGIPAVIKEVRGNDVTAVFEKPHVFAVGATLKLQIPKKIIAIVDFEVIRGREKEAGRVTLEGLTSALIESGHFTVIERSKLKTIINELELSLSGLIKEPPEKIIGKLLTADIILTGTLAEISGVWDINLRLVNVRTGQAMAAIAMRTPLFKPAEMRDAGPMNEDFEGDVVDPAWLIGSYSGGAYQLKLDPTQGALNSKRSFRIDFDLSKGPQRIFAHADNRKKRDISSFSGIEFYVKSEPSVTGHLVILMSDRKDPNMIDAWSADFETGSEWKIMKIHFEQLRVGRHWIKGAAVEYGAKPGEQIMDLSRTEVIMIGVYKPQNLPVKGTMWIDKVRFYRD